MATQQQRQHPNRLPGSRRSPGTAMRRQCPPACQTPPRILGVGSPGGRAALTPRIHTPRGTGAPRGPPACRPRRPSRPGCWTSTTTSITLHSRPRSRCVPRSRGSRAARCRRPSCCGRRRRCQRCSRGRACSPHLRRQPRRRSMRCLLRRRSMASCLLCQRCALCLRQSLHAGLGTAAACRTSH